MKCQNLKLIFLTAYIIICQNPIFGQWESFQYQNPIENVTETWQELELQDDIYSKIKKGKEDLRIFGLTENGDTLEVPYILKNNESKLESTAVSFQKINETHNKVGSFFTFEMKELEQISEIHLDIEQENFDWTVRLEGSNDQKEWFSILEDYRIVSIKNGETDYQFTKLKFGAVKYQYFRIAILLTEAVKLKTAQIYKNEVMLGNEKNWEFDWQIEHDKKEQTTTILLNSEKPIPISKMKILVDSEVDYYRNFSLQYLKDSVKTEKGMHYQFGFLEQGILSSLEDNEFEFSTKIAKQLKLTVKNYDNAPLEFKEFELSGSIPSLVARFPEKTSKYYFVYGNENVFKPNYDLVNFQERIPEDLQLLKLGKEEKIVQKEKEEASPFFENKIWLWGLMLVVIGILGYFTLGMMKEV